MELRPRGEKLTGVKIGMNMKYLPWQLFGTILIVFSIICAYGALTHKDKSKSGNIFLICLAIFAFLTGIDTLASHIGILLEYLPFFEPISYIFLVIAMFIVFLSYFLD